MIKELFKRFLSLSVILAFLFIIFEPAISHSNQFTISQTITTEVAFSTNASDIIMSPTIGGLTGGIANGATQFAIRTNGVAGFNVTIQASSSDGSMIGNASSTNKITGYTTLTDGIPDHVFTVRNASGVAFGYTVEATSTDDVVQSFKHNGATCGTGSNNGSLTNCWIAATSTPFTIINRTMPTFGGQSATSTIAFRVVVNANPNPTLPNDTYVATTTLTATAN